MGNRVGPDGSRPYLYEGVFAHEYQHLLHDDYDGDEENFVNEGLSMFSEFLTGYIFGNDAYSTFEELPENSLVAWGDQGGREVVADYGIVFLYQMYLYEKFGQEFIQAEFHNPVERNIEHQYLFAAVQDTKPTFDDIYHDFSVAVLINSRNSDYQYGFDALDVAIDIGHQGERNPDAYDTPGAPPWGTDYIWVEVMRYGKIHLQWCWLFQIPNSAWTSDGDVLYSGTGDLLDNLAIFETIGGGTLTFDTYWDIEDFWDFGFVQVSTDGGTHGQVWQTHATVSSYDPNAIPT